MHTRLRLLPLLFFTLATASLGGVAELSLDRVIVQDLLVAATPSSFDIDLPGRRTATVELGAAHRTRFVEGTVETTFPLRVPALGFETQAVVRYVADFEPLYGKPRLLVQSARLEGLDFDLAALLPPVTFPQSGEWTVSLGARADEPALAVTYFVQGLVIESERIRLDLGLRVAPEH